MAKGDCTVVMNDENGEVAGNLTIVNGHHVNIGSNTTLTCTNGNVTVSETKATSQGGTKPSGGPKPNPVIVSGTQGLRLKE
jgi:hypothetical protein